MTPIHVQIIEFIKKHASRIDKEKWATLELEIKGGNLDGMRVKEYVKNDNTNKSL